MIRGFVISFLLVVLVLSAGAANRALLVGIGEYDQMATGWGRIHGDADVALLKPLLTKRGFTDIVTLTNAEAKKKDIVNALRQLAARCKPGDKVYFHFSGHGQPISDENRDEANGKQFDESIIPYDACRDSRKMNGKYVGQFHLIDDELCPLLNEIKKAIGSNGEMFVAVDACYSKGIQKDEMTDTDPELLRYARGTDHAFVPKGHKSYLSLVPKPDRFTSGAKMWVATACQSNERNLEYRSDSGKMYGSLSYYISLLLKSNADFGSWANSIREHRYATRGIFQPSQHPSIEFIP